MNRTRVSRTLALGAALLLAASLSWAGGGGEKTVSGCLVQLDGQFVLTSADGKQHRISAESGANLDANLGKQVEVRGTVDRQAAHQAGIAGGEYSERTDTATSDTARTGQEGNKEGKLIRATSVNTVSERCQNASIALVESDAADMTASTTGTDSAVAGTDATSEAETARADSDTSVTSEQQPDTLGAPEQPSEQAQTAEDPLQTGTETDTTRADTAADVDVDTSTETESEATATAEQPDPMVVPQEPAEDTATTETARADSDANTDVATGTEPAITEPQEPATDPATSGAATPDDTARADTDIAEGQATEPMMTAGQNQLRGCLTRDASGNYQFTADDGRSFQLRDDANLLGQFAGKKVTIETTQDSSLTAGTTAPETSAAGTATTDIAGELNVRRIQATGESCEAVPSTPPQR